MTEEKWSTEELRAAVLAYIDMRTKEVNGENYVKKEYYANLAERFDRTEKSFEYRMQNISYVYSLMGRPWVTGLKPAKNVGAKVTKEIELWIQEIEGQSLQNSAEFSAKVNSAKKKKFVTPPSGSKKPNTTSNLATQYQRDPNVVAWVLDQASGVCEGCCKKAPFQKEDGTPYLEVHHLRMLADGGSDTISNAIALCPNCHREFHFGNNKKELSKKAILKVQRLRSE